jgi:nicotinamidase/pyrazinamidase
VTVDYDRRTALVVVDVQNDFADPRGSLYVRGGAEVVEVVNDAVRSAGAAGATVAYTQDWHPADTPHFAKDGGVWPVHCVAGTWGAELHPALVVEGERVRKGTGGEDGYSGFTMADPLTRATRSTGLVELLRQRSVQKVVVAGLATDYCVKATALDAVELGFPTTVLTAAVRPVEIEEGDGERALAEMRDAGVALA